MPSAFVLLNVGSGSEDDILKQLKTISAIKEVYVSYGVYDLIMKIQTGTMEELKETVSHKIRPIINVQSTLTLILVEE